MEQLDGKVFNGPSIKDELTGLYTMSWIMTQLYPDGPIEVTADAIVVFINIMNFKAFNRRFGFEGGNDYFRGLARELERIFTDDLIARAGGDHFIIIAKNLTDELVEKKLLELDEAMLEHDKGFRMHIKAGIYHSDGTEPFFVMLIDRAKMACDVVSRVYDRDFVFFDDDLREKNELRQYVVEHFEEAFEKEYFTVFYQPVVRAMTGNICGYEALARWRDPIHGMISPAIFIEVLESVRLIHKLDRFVINRVCKDIRDRLDAGYVCQPVSLNLSRLDFELCDVKKVLQTAIGKYGIPKEYIFVEVTESAAASGMRILSQQLINIREMGIKVWLDDFGSGYSSFNNLLVYEFDMLKIDMEFIKALGVNKKADVIVASIISMAKRLGLPTLAEGVETKEQFDFLKRIGCEKIQGYYFGKPADITEMSRSTMDDLGNDENPEFRDYFNQAGAINFLSNTPLKLRKHDGEREREVYNSLPITLIEVDNHSRAIRFVYFNKAYQNFINSFGIQHIDDVEEFFGEEGRRIMEGVFNTAEAHPDSQHEFEFELADGTVINCYIRLLSKTDTKSMFGYVVRRKDV